VQTDRGTEFFAEQVQRLSKLNFIKFRSIPPRSPHLNGKGERSQGHPQDAPLQRENTSAAGKNFSLMHVF